MQNLSGESLIRWLPTDSHLGKINKQSTEKKLFRKAPIYDSSIADSSNLSMVNIEPAEPNLRWKTEITRYTF